MTPVLGESTVKQVLTSRVYEAAIETPLERATKISMIAGCDIYLKREDLQPVHSFKIRGAYNKMAQLTQAEKDRGVIAASAGNHAQGVSLAAKMLGINALIVMPRTTPSIKIDAVLGYGAEVELYGDSYSEAADYCKQRITETGRTYVHPFDDPLVIAGQGTIGKEIIEQLPQATHVFVCVGGGGMLAGIASYVKEIRPDIKIISVEPEDSAAMARSIKAGERLVLPHVGIFADGVAVKQVGEHTFAAAQKYVDDYITVTTDELCSAIKLVFEDTRSIVEPAGALGVAGVIKYNLPAEAHAIAICSGANVTFERLQQIAERTMLGSGKEALFAVSMPEKPGALQNFCQDVIHNRNITEFAYRLHSRKGAHVLVGISVKDAQDRTKLAKHINAAGYACTDLSTDETTKEHVRHMVGGPANEVASEAIYQVNFPERPGALGDFLAELANRWNISLFHYRSAASDIGQVLIGLETTDTIELEKALQNTKYVFERVDDSAGIKTYLRD